MDAIDGILPELREIFGRNHLRVLYAEAPVIGPLKDIAIRFERRAIRCIADRVSSYLEAVRYRLLRHCANGRAIENQSDRGLPGHPNKARASRPRASPARRPRSA